MKKVYRLAYIIKDSEAKGYIEVIKAEHETEAKNKKPYDDHIESEKIIKYFESEEELKEYMLLISVDKWILKRDDLKTYIEYNYIPSFQANQKGYFKVSYITA